MRSAHQGALAPERFFRSRPSDAKNSHHHYQAASLVSPRSSTTNKAPNPSLTSPPTPRPQDECTFYSPSSVHGAKTDKNPTVRSREPPPYAAGPVRPTALPRDCRRLRRRFSRDANANADLVRSVDKDIVVRLKWGETEYKGRLVSIDSYMNIQLRDTEEYIDQKMTGTLGQVLIRYIPPVPFSCSKLPPKPSEFYPE